MSMFSFSKPKILTTLQQQGGILADDIRRLAGHSSAHIKSLVALLRLELAEYVKQRRRQALLYAVAGVFLLVAYLSFCLLCGIMMYRCTGSCEGAVVFVLLLNLLAACFVFAKAVKSKPAPLAEATREEIKNDIACLKILFSKEKEDS